MKERIDKVAKYAIVMADRYLWARQKLAIMELLVSGDIAQKVDDSYGAHAYETLSLTLAMDLIRDAFALTLDSDDRAPSLANVWKLMSAEDLRTALRDVAGQPVIPPMTFGDGFTKQQQVCISKSLEVENAETRCRDFDQAYSDAAIGVTQTLDSDLAKKISRARKKAIAHYDMRLGKSGPELFKLSDAGLTWGSSREFLDMLNPVLLDVVRLAAGRIYDVEGYDRRDRLYAADVWARLQGRAPVDHID
jgi:hypothetical protein